MIKAIAIDDENAGLEIIRSWAAQCDQISLEKCFTSAPKALDYIQEFPVDIIFLDIQMPQLSGIELAGKIPAHVKIIFTTAFSEYAVKGFELNAIDYLLKPISLDRFLAAVDRAKNRIISERNVDLDGQNCIYIRTDFALVKIKFQEIMLVEAFDDYIKIHKLSERPTVARMTMKAILEKLPSNFVRVHRGWIINKDHLTKHNARTAWVGQHEIPISPGFKF